VRQNRLVQLRITIKDTPGGLAGLLDRVARARANVLHLNHDRTFTDAAFWQVQVGLTLETRSRQHIEELISDLRSHGYEEVEEVRSRPLPPTLPGP
jgi:threonine dehydratase